MLHKIGILAVAAMAAITVAGCNSAASPSGTTSGAASAAPSALLPSIEVPSGLASALPSMALPSPDAALEALLPNQLCGTDATKSSAAGGTFAAGDAQIQAFLQSLGKTSSDLSFAAEVAGTTGCSASIVKVQGASATQMHDQFVTAVSQGGAAPQEKSIGGKSVLVGTQPNSFGYAYFKDDMLIFFSAPDDTKAGEVAATLP
jgi:hypothetical protein